MEHADNHRAGGGCHVDKHCPGVIVTCSLKFEFSLNYIFWITIRRGSVPRCTRETHSFPIRRQEWLVRLHFAVGELEMKGLGAHDRLHFMAPLMYRRKGPAL